MYNNFYNHLECRGTVLVVIGEKSNQICEEPTERENGEGRVGDLSEKKVASKRDSEEI